MASLDYAQDLIDLFKQNSNEYVLVVIQPGKRKDKAVVFYNAHQESSAKLLGETLQYVAQEILNTPVDGANHIREDKPKKSR